MKVLGEICRIYCIASCVACVVHMWRNRKEKGVVKVYAWTFLLMLYMAIGFGVVWE